MSIPLESVGLCVVRLVPAISDTRIRHLAGGPPMRMVDKEAETDLRREFDPPAQAIFQAIVWPIIHLFENQM
jgi:hypothetical protein